MAQAPQAIALDMIRLAQAGQFDQICERFSPQLRTVVSSEVLQAG